MTDTITALRDTRAPDGEGHAPAFGWDGETVWKADALSGYAGDMGDRQRDPLAPRSHRRTADDVLSQALEADALAAALDWLNVGVVIVADRNRILHANELARQMLARRQPIVSKHGRLVARDRAAQDMLSRVIESVCRGEATSGAGIAMQRGVAEPAVAHVVPLARGGLPTSAAPQAASVFVTMPRVAAPAFDFNVLAQSHGLTPMEILVVQHLTANATVNVIADRLKVSQVTIRTHLLHVFAKTGVSRQADLISLVGRMAPPVRRHPGMTASLS